MENKYDLVKFVSAQERDYETALREIQRGRKSSHWIWYIFPQLKGLGRSGMSDYYGIHDLTEAKEFLDDPYLGKNLREISETLLKLDGNDARLIMGSPDDMKLRSSMTLFSLVSPDDVFDKVIDKFFDGRKDRRTGKMLGML